MVYTIGTHTMSKGIVCRKGRYYFRVRLPADVAHKTGKREIKRSLGTGNLVEARRRARPLIALVAHMRVMSDLDTFLQHMRDAGISADSLTDYTIDKLKVGNVEIEGLQVDPNRPGDAEAAAMAIRAAVESQPTTTTLPATIEKRLPPLRDGIEAYIAEKMGESWTGRTADENKSLFDLLLKIIGPDITGDQVSYETARNVKSKLLKLPPNIDKSAKYKGKSIDEIIDMGDEPRAVSTVNKLLIRYSSLLRWLKRHGYVEKNYFEELTIKQKKNSRDDRRPYTDEELRTLFDHLLKTNIKHSYQQWAPLIGLYTGMRLEEICQLHVSDIKQHIDLQVWVFDVNCEGSKKLKNVASARLVPIHSALIKMGLFEFVDKQHNAGHERLFPELKRISGRYSHAASKWFGEIRKKLDWFGLEPKLDFHSFRHTVATRLLHADVDEYKIAAILGHAFGQSETGKTYAKRPGPEITKDAIELLNYDIVGYKPCLF